jgi:hypothetical protein
MQQAVKKNRFRLEQALGATEQQRRTKNEATINSNACSYSLLYVRLSSQCKLLLAQKGGKIYFLANQP